MTALGMWLAPSGPAAATPVTPGPAQRVAEEPVWIAPGEARFGNSVLIGRELSLDGDRIRFEYDLVSLGPGYESFFSDPGTVTAAPATFLADLASGDAVEGTLPVASPRSVTFVVPDGVTVDDVVSLRLTEWRVRVPIDFEVTLRSELGASATLPDGSIITVATILEQRNGTIIQFDHETPPDAWPEPRQNPGATPDFAGAGPGWRLAGGSDITRGFQLTWAGATAPDEMTIRVRIAPWHPVAADIEISLPQERG